MSKGAQQALYAGLGLKSPFIDNVSPIGDRNELTEEPKIQKRGKIRKRLWCPVKRCRQFQYSRSTNNSSRFFQVSRIFTKLLDSKGCQTNHASDVLPEQKLALLTETAFPANALPKFLLFSPQGIVEVSCQHLGSIMLDAKEMDSLLTFRDIVFRDILRLDYDKKMGITLAPLMGSHIDWTLLFSLSQETPRPSKPLLSPPGEALLDLVVVPIHREMGCFFVNKIRRDLSPTSKMPASSTTFEEYYSSKYNCHVKDTTQPLLSVSNANSIQNALVPPPLEKKPKDASQAVMLIPELTKIHHLPLAIWRECHLLPFALHRLNFLNNLHDFAKDNVLLQSEKLKCPKTSSRQFVGKPGEFEEIISNRMRRSHLSSLQVLMSPFTFAAAGESFHLEREEFLGDCFLKYVTTLSLFLANPSFGEGELTSLRSRIVGNDNLCHLAARHCGMGNIVNADRFDLAKSFAPLLSSDGLALCLTSKSLADCLEAVIGAVLLDCGQSKAIELMMNMGIKLFPFEVENGLLYTDGSQRPECLKNDNTRVRLWKALGLKFPVGDLSWIADCNINAYAEYFPDNILLRIESILNYSFQQRGFLRMALTLAMLKSQAVTESNERLEFLGDGVIDYLVTLNLYLRFPEMSAGNLTELRSTIVNNRAFAEVVVSSGLSDLLVIKDDFLKQKIELFKASLTRNDGKWLTTDDYDVDNIAMQILSEEECPTFVISDPPKILGDVFESLVGAVFLDSGKDLSCVWNALSTVYKLMEDKIMQPTKQPVKELLEKFPCQVKFRDIKSNEDFISQGKTVFVAEIRLTGSTTPCFFKGVGDNKKEAREAAAKCAVEVINLLGD